MTETSNRPTHYVYHVSRKENGEKGHWTRIGAAWPHKDGDGLTIRVEAIPMSGELVVRTPRPEETQP